ncbi:MAG: hypothetical protein WCF90_11005 [Methanomicrobiales archaeon]
MEHSQLGRLTKGWDKKANEAVMKVLGIEVPKESSLKEGPSEKQIVYSALNDSMSIAVKEVFEKSLEWNCTLRIAGFMLAISRIAQCYEDAGIF